MSESNLKTNLYFNRVGDVVNLVTKEIETLEEEFSSDNLNKLHMHLFEYIFEWGEVRKHFETFSKHIYGLVENISDTAGNLASTRQLGMSNEAFINQISKAINSHKNWVKTAEEMVNKMDLVPLETDEHLCAFGHFYYTISPKNNAIKDVWSAVEPVHSNLHKYGVEIINCIKKWDSAGAKSSLEIAKSYSVKIVSMFDQINKITLDLGDASVFY